MLFTLSLGIGLLIGMIFLAVLLLVDHLSRTPQIHKGQQATQWSFEKARAVRRQN